MKPAGRDQPVPSGGVAVLGVPFDANSSFLRGPALAPARIRETLASGAGNDFTESGVGLDARSDWADLGDLRLPDPTTAFDAIESEVDRILAGGARPFILGGDHAITSPVLRACARHYAGLTVIHLHAHPDLYDALDGNRNSHASPFARAMETIPDLRLVQVGIRATTAHQREQADRFGVRTVEMKDWYPGYPLDLSGPLYLSLDLDVLDPAFAPGVSHHEPGGMTTREVLGVLSQLPVPFIGADLVEFNPLRDPTGITAAVAAKLFKEILGRLLAGPPSDP
mgnify:CR=1 FL=1